MTIRKTIALLIVIPALCFYGNAVAGEKVAVIISSREAPFDETLTGFQEYLQKHGVQADYEVYNIESDVSKAGIAIQKVKASRVSLIYSLGSLATNTVIKEIPDIPIIACLILRSDTIKKASNVTGVALEFPLETQFKWLQRFLPDARTIGVIYNPDENQKKIEAAAKVAQKMGFRLEAQGIRTPQEVPAALDILSKRVDALWGVADNLVLTPQIAKQLLLVSFRNRIPFIGLSSTWVKAGAIYSLEWDYKDMGAQCGEMAQKILEGASPNEIPPATPRKVMYSVNLTTARQMKINISEELIRGAHQTY